MENQTILSVVADELAQLSRCEVAPEKIQVSTLIRNNYYIGKKYLWENMMAIWYVDHSVIEFFDRTTGQILNSVPLSTQSMTKVA